MLKFIITASALAISAPALAQTVQDQAQTTPNKSATTTAPAQDPTSPAPSGDPAAAQPAPAAAQPDAAAQPASGGGIAQVVDQGWSTYDVNGDGKLSETEFAAWMNKVKGDSDPKLKPDSPATKKWNQAAFAQADTDKSRSLSKAELTAFLSKGQQAS